MKAKKQSPILRAFSLLTAAAFATALALEFAGSADRAYDRVGHESFELYGLATASLLSGAAAVVLCTTVLIELLKARDEPNP